MITIVDYGLGNLASVANALNKIDAAYEITDKIAKISNAKAVILPGVGSAAAGMKNLKANGMDKVIVEKALSGTPILGICLGMQIMMSYSEEGDTECLDLIKGKVKKFSGKKNKIPQIGWNKVEFSIFNFQFSKKKKNILFKNIIQDSYFYFVNSYYCDPADEEVVAGVTNYGINFCSAFEYKNIFGVQFHPEKSGENGLQLLRNFNKSAMENKDRGI